MTSDDNSPAFSAGGIDLSLLSLTSNNAESGSHGEEMQTAAELSADEVAIVFSFLPPQSIMHARVCKTWRDAAIKTFVPPNDFIVYDVKSYNAMRAMSTALPNLQQLTLYSLRNEKFGDLPGGHKYSDGEDPKENLAARTATHRIYDINIVSNFSKLRILKLYNAPLNGRYPALFSFPLLEELIISDCFCFKLDLEMLSGLPRLKKLDCNMFGYGSYPTGNLSSLRVLKNTLENVTIDSQNIRGSLMELADFPHLKVLNLVHTSVTGDIRDIRSDDFPAVKSLMLPKFVVGGIDYEFERISEVPVFMQTIHPLVRRSPSLALVNDWNGYGDWRWRLSRDSPDWYDADADERIPEPPFSFCFIRAGTRLGWCWYDYDEEDYHHHYCEVNWLDLEPSSDSSDYETYAEELQRLERRFLQRISRATQ